jgi:predicted nuclease of predicted toxin-antitoxin system
MRFLVDMGISTKTVVFLQDLGCDVAHLHEEGLNRMTDPEVLIKARTERCVLLTNDIDCADLMDESGAGMPSVVIFRLRNMRPDNINRSLKHVIERYSDLLREGALLGVGEGCVRVRMLPAKDAG